MGISVSFENKERVTFSHASTRQNDPVLATKNEEEEFNTGPLSVLMMSVRNNTQPDMLTHLNKNAQHANV
ncbi:hypothetical protein SAY86_021304 [Trapa natans]|uniref:Uncharacterized protein n=1 Tax=Trapa natans TaxID=22666 RepID=A0AAN7M9Q9_TRANT|nr:hypothetical protein SAY86_021304 [Trapa natans]